MLVICKTVVSCFAGKELERPGCRAGERHAGLLSGGAGRIGKELNLGSIGKAYGGNGLVLPLSLVSRSQRALGYGNGCLHAYA
jgi:hypothetical protein